MDVLSDLLRTVRLTGAVFHNAEFTAPWAFRSPHSRSLAPYIRAGASHVVVYHLVTEGRAWAHLENGPPVEVSAGEIIMFPHGDPHLMGNGEPLHVADNGAQLQAILGQGLDVVRMGGGGEVTRYVCGYLICEPDAARLLFDGLPPLVTVNIRDRPSGAWIENAIRSSVAQAATSEPGADAVLARLSEALFAETLRRYLTEMPQAETGWLAGCRDAHVGRALALLHGDVARAWTIASLAQEVGLSRTLLAERFRRYVGEPPMAYLTRWRLLLGARLLGETRRSIGEIAAEVGYDSEAAFNRAFKRLHGLPPARFRKARA